MGKTIVFLNLADRDQCGLAAKSTKSLAKKYPSQGFVTELLYGANRIYRVDLFGMLALHRNPSLANVEPSGVDPVRPQLLGGHASFLPAIAREQLAISMLCGTANTIMLGVHGQVDDTEQGFAGLGWDQGTGVVGNWTEFADLTSSFLLPSKSYKLALIVCFGARSSEFRKDHDKALLESDIKSSFAYKFYSRICTKADITMTARTGSVGFNDQSGVSEVQTESGVLAEIEYEELQRANQTKDIADAYEKLQQKECVNVEGRNRFRAWQTNMEAGKEPVNPEERVIKRYLELKQRINLLTGQKAEDRPKYGKFVYTYKNGMVTVYRKYEDGKKTMSVLYQGQL